MRERGGGGTERHEIQLIIQNGKYNIFKLGYKLGYILTKLAKLPFVLFTKIAYTSLYNGIM